MPVEGYFQQLKEKKKKVVLGVRQFRWLELSQGKESLLLMGEKLIAGVDVYESSIATF